MGETGGPNTDSGLEAAECPWELLPMPPCVRQPDVWNPAADQPGLSPCAGAADCGPDEFCGAGTCRTIADTPVTYCLNSATLQGFLAGGAAVDEAVLRMTLQAVAGRCLDYHHTYGDMLRTTEKAGCESTWNMCRLTYLGASWPKVELLFDPNHLDPVFQWVDFNWEGALTVDAERESVNQGCIVLEKEGAWLDVGDDYRMEARVSIWFP